ncbi:MAG: peptide MFS transporter [Bacteroidales bacterium]|nr:peptide MFS transporter [Bacteroidales bacterium]MBN2757150.1 peptide MFS transporter [Bacteroidales bacterium]
MAKESKHPKGLMVLFFTEMWERFGFYLMLGIFTLYMLAGGDEKFPGLGLNRAESADIYGTYLALVYLTPFFGGLLADRVLGYRKSIFIGGLLMASGYIGLSIPNSMPMFFGSLMLIILGNGLFKPNISVLLGKLYEGDQYAHLKDSGFSIFYMGINLGAFVCNFVAAYLRIKYGWGWAFAAAGVGMIIGVVWLMFGQMAAPRIKEVDVITPPNKDDMTLMQIFLKLFVPALIAAIIGWIIPGNIFGADSTDAFLFFSIPIVLFYINLVRTAPEKEKEPIKALLSIMGVVVVFWAIFHQNGSALTFWAKNNTDRVISQSIEPAFSFLELVEEVSTIPREVEESGLHGEKGETVVGPSYYFKNYTKALPTGLTERPDDISKEYWDEHVKDKVEVSNYGAIKLWPTELQASINPGYIIILTPLVVGFFGFLARRGKEPSTPAKIGYGLLITSLSMTVMVGAAIVSDSGLTKTSAGWLFGIYGVITVGELFLSPMGLSLVSKLSPKRIAALMMGGWFLSTAIGNKLSGVLSGFWDAFDKKEYFFLTNVGLTLIAAIAIFLLLPWLRKVVEENTGNS